MKILSVVLLLGIIACGRSPVGSGSLGRKFSTSQQAISANEATALQTICGALAQKQSALQQGTGLALTYNVAQRDCGTGSQSRTSTVTVNVESTGTSFPLRRADNNSLFIYPDAETPISGVMRSVCSALTDRLIPVKVDDSNFVTFNTGSFPECTPGVGEACIQIIQGTASGTDSFTENKQEWIRFRTSGARLGFFSFRRTISNSFCAAGETMETLATLQQ